MLPFFPCHIDVTLGSLRAELFRDNLKRKKVVTMNKLISLFKRSEKFWIATGIRCARTFLTTVLGCWTVGTSITSVDWKETLLVSVSTTVYIFLTCLVGGLPEVDEP